MAAPPPPGYGAPPPGYGAPPPGYGQPPPPGYGQQLPVAYGQVMQPPQQVMSDDIFGPQFNIKQKVTKRDLLENTLGVEMGNFYNVQPFGEKGNKNSELPWKMYVDEKSDNWCGRICCGPTRGLTFDVFYPKKESEGGMKILELKKPFICCEPCCACCCCFCTGCCKPKFEVTATENFPGNKRGEAYKIGYVQDHCQVCGTREEIHKTSDGGEKHLYTIKGSCCQCGACLPAGGSASYPIYDGEHHDREIGEFKKMGGGIKQFAMELLADAQTFQVTCPDNAHNEEKALLLAAGLMVDLQYYEQTNDKPDELGGYADMVFYNEKSSIRSSSSSASGASDYSLRVANFPSSSSCNSDTDHSCGAAGMKMKNKSGSSSTSGAAGVAGKANYGATGWTTSECEDFSSDDAGATATSSPSTRKAQSSGASGVFEESEL
ncbi:unnamed protein product [Amoebophrya sp. A120]|nr:unnamed protein product [Amoebophrya sp. A120]|eukprot:GSA120T00013585001.1